MMAMNLVVKVFWSLALLQALVWSKTINGNYGRKSANNRRILAWICLEFCEESQQNITYNLAQVERHKDIISAVSFEKYTLGPDSTLVDNNLTEVASKINAIGVEAWPLLSSYPHYPEFIDWMRTVFANPQPFFDACISEAKKYNYVGYNLDWEPTDGVVASDAQSYADFVELFAQTLHAEGLGLTVDMATWSPVWNYTMLAATSLDTAISMGTYTSTDTSFTSQLDKLVTAFGAARSGVGLETVNASTEALMPIDEVIWRFQQIEAAQVNEVDLWKLPVPETWWPILSSWVKRG